MYDQLEQDISGALRVRAADVPPEAVERLRRADYKPRTHRLPVRAVGALGGAATTTGAIVGAVVLTTAQPAFAGWKADPTTPSPSQVASADGSCQGQLASMPPGLAPATGSTWTALDVDVRGPFTVAVYSDGSADATCFDGPSFTFVTASALGSQHMSSGSLSASGASGAGSPGSGGPAAGNSFQMMLGPSGALSQVGMAHLSSSEGPYTLVEGQLGPDVSALTLVRSDGVAVQASVTSGVFVAWWPGSEAATTAEVTTPGGTSSEALNFPPSNLPPPPGASGSAAQSGSTTTVPYTPATTMAGGPATPLTTPGPGA